MNKLHAIVLAVLIASGTAHADLITWGTVQSATGPAEISQNGTLVTAKNCWNTTSASPTVAGITFAAFGPTGWGNGGNLVMNGSTSGDTAYDTLVTTSRATSETTLTNPTGWGGIRIDNLGTPMTLGRTYEIQVWYCDNRPGAGTAAIYDRQMTLSSVAGAATLTGGIVTNLGTLTQGALSGLLDADPNNLAGAGDTVFGSYCIGTFTRTSADALYLLVQGTHPTSTNTLRPHINAFQIRELPLITGTAFCFGDGAGLACPCGNNGAAGNGCANSINANGANLTATGAANLAADTVILAGSGMANSSALYFQGTTRLNAGNGALFGDGLRCAGGTVVRLGTKTNAAGASSYPAAGDLSVSTKGLITAPGTYTYQAWYRNADQTYCTPSTFNLTNGYEIVWN
jgi:hypothetical protein